MVLIVLHSSFPNTIPTPTKVNVTLRASLIHRNFKTWEKETYKIVVWHDLNSIGLANYSNLNQSVFEATRKTNEL